MNLTERKLAAILAADVISYSKLMSNNEEETLQLLKTIEKEVLIPAIENNNGRVFKKMGDGYLVEFPSIVGAINSAIEIQTIINERDPSSSNQKVLKFRIGVNLGDVIVDSGDIFGDGVNIAARLEAICEPNCIAITQRVHEEIYGKINHPFSSIGMQKLKNIDNKIEIFIWKPELEISNSNNNKIELNTDYGLPSKPSIAVLPFSNMSNDPEQEYFCDGITEDIITELSRFDNIFVISRNTSFTYKNTPVDLKTAAQELSVQYILEGSVRKSGQRVRITTQLIDGIEDTHIWAERYDGLLEDVFDLQEQVTQQVVMSLVPEILAIQALKSSSSKRVFDESYNKAWKAAALANEGSYSNRPDYIDESLKLCIEAIKNNPECEVAYNTAGLCYLIQSLFRWGSDPSSAADRSLELARSLLSHIKNSITGYRMLGMAKSRLGDFEGAILDLQKARELNPNDSETTFGLAYALVCVGNSEESKRFALMAHRLSPKDPYLGRFFYLSMAMCFFIERDKKNFILWAEKAIQASPYAPIRRALMIAYAMEENDIKLAQIHFAALNNFAPGFISSVLSGENVLFSDEEHKQRLNEGLNSFLAENKC